MKRRADKVDSSAVTQAIDDVSMSDAVEGNSLILKICNEGLLQICVWIFLEV
jgi:hypothetical protein